MEKRKGGESLIRHARKIASTASSPLQAADQFVANVLAAYSAALSRATHHRPLRSGLQPLPNIQTEHGKPDCQAAGRGTPAV